MPTFPLPKPDGFNLDADTTHTLLNFMLCQWLPRVMNPHAAAQTRLRIAWVFVGTGGGTWTMNIDAGKITVCEERPPEVRGHLLDDTVDAPTEIIARADRPTPDLTFTQSPEAFFKTLHLWLDPMVGLLTGEIKVQGFEHVRELNLLFSEPGHNVREL